MLQSPKSLRSITISSVELETLVDWLVSCKLVPPVGLLDQWRVTSEACFDSVIKTAPLFFLAMVRQSFSLENSGDDSTRSGYPTLCVQSGEMPGRVATGNGKAGNTFSLTWLRAIDRLGREVLWLDNKSGSGSKISSKLVSDWLLGWQQSDFKASSLAASAGSASPVEDWDDSNWYYQLGIKDNARNQRAVKVIRRVVSDLLRVQNCEQHRLDDKLLAMKQLGYGASHEFNNPLANIATRAQTLARDETNLDRKQVLQVMNAQAFRGFDMLANLMHFSSPPAPKIQNVNVEEICQQAIVEIQSFFAAERTTEIEVRIAAERVSSGGGKELRDEEFNDEEFRDDASEGQASEGQASEGQASEEPVSEEPVSEEPVSEEPVSEEPVSEEPASKEPALKEQALHLAADPQHLLMLLKALLRNAVEAGGDRVLLEVSACELPDGSPSLKFQVSDNGPTVDPQLLSKMVDPFFSGREAGRGLGFGLSLAYQIVRQHHGQLCLTAKEPGGMAVSAILPVKMGHQSPVES